MIPAGPLRNAGGDLPSGGMSDDDFSGFARIIHAETGIVINATKRSMLVSRLSRRLRALGLGSFSEYRSLLDSRDSGAERRELISAITTNVTGFFREPVHFDTLADLVPDLQTRTRSGDRVRIWSAGCSSGEEPYSIAMTLHDKWPGIAQSDLRILATDIDPQMVEKSRHGEYTTHQLGEDPHPLVIKYTKRRPGTETHDVDPALKANLRFEELNLLGDWPFQGSFDIIFCRNVVIYFDAPTRARLWRRFAERLKPGGTLFIGHSERIDPGLETVLVPSGVTQYRRTAASVPPGAEAVQATAPPDSRQTRRP